MNYEAKYELVKYACSRQSQEEAGMEKQATPLGIAFAGMSGYDAYKAFKKGNWWGGLGHGLLAGVSLIPGAGMIRGGIGAIKGLQGVARGLNTATRVARMPTGMLTAGGRAGIQARGAAARSFNQLSNTAQRAQNVQRFKGTGAFAGAGKGYKGLGTKLFGAGNKMNTAMAAGLGIAAGGWANAASGQQGQQGGYQGTQYAGGGGYGGLFNTDIGTTGFFAQDRESVSPSSPSPGRPQSPVPQPRFASRYS
jgi:hypothetical protein